MTLMRSQSPQKLEQSHHHNSEVVARRFSVKNNVLRNFAKFTEKQVSRSVFAELQLRQISMNFTTSCCNLKIRDLGAKLCLFFIILFLFLFLFCLNFVLFY